MNARKKLNLNLASRPLRNRKLFFLLCFFLVVVMLAVAFKAGRVYFTYKINARGMTTSDENTDQLIKKAQRDEKRYSSQIEKTSLISGKKIDLINSIILNKSFSWIDFLNSLENSLPESSYIVSLNPSLTRDSKMEVRLKVVSLNLDELLEFLTRLNSLDFKQIRITDEIKNEYGQLLSEISLIYDRNI
ncbi:hypothetical protein ACFLRM_00830 [Acidobacteriota bacterium]